MLSYCLKCRENTENKNQKVKTKKQKNDHFIKLRLTHSKKSKFIKEQEASEIIGTLAKFLSQIPLLGHSLFYWYNMYKQETSFHW